MKLHIFLATALLVSAGCASLPSTPPVSRESTIVAPAAAPSVEAPRSTEASEEFRAFMRNLKITGVFAGPTVRILANGKVFHLGDVIDGTLGVTLASHRPDAKLLVFTDKTGAMVFRSY